MQGQTRRSALKTKKILAEFLAALPSQIRSSFRRRVVPNQTLKSAPFKGKLALQVPSCRHL